MSGLPHLPVVQIEHEAIARNHRDLVLLLGKYALVEGVAALLSDVDDLLTEAGYFLMTLGHQDPYDLF